MIGSVKNTLKYINHKELKSTLRKLINKHGEDDHLKESIHLYQGLETILDEKEKVIEELNK